MVSFFGFSVRSAAEGFELKINGERQADFDFPDRSAEAKKPRLGGAAGGVGVGGLGEGHLPRIPQLVEFWLDSTKPRGRVKEEVGKMDERDKTIPRRHWCEYPPFTICYMVWVDLFWCQVLIVAHLVIRRVGRLDARGCRGVEDATVAILVDGSTTWFRRGHRKGDITYNTMLVNQKPQDLGRGSFGLIDLSTNEDPHPFWAVSLLVSFRATARVRKTHMLIEGVRGGSFSRS